MNTFEKVTDFDDILDFCLARMQSGEALEQCLADYPEWAGELRPLLTAATAVQSTSRPAARTQAVEQGQAAMLAALANQKKEAVGGTAVSFGALRRYAERILSVLKTEETPNMRPALRSIFTTLFVVFISGFFALAISANSLPGEPFYPLKLGWESARLGLTFDPDARQQLESQIQENRQGELAALIELGRQTQIAYEGIVEEVGDEQLVVDSFVFELNAGTRRLVEPKVGKAVRIVTEISAAGRLTALEISAGSLPERPLVVITATPTPCNDPTCVPPTATPTPCNAGACNPSPTPPPTATTNSPTPTPCNTPNCASPTATPTVCNAGACNPSPTAPPTSTTNTPTPTPCNTPACSTPNATPTVCNVGVCGSPTPPPPATSTPNVPTPTPVNPTPTPCNDPACAPTPTPCNTGACGDPTPPPPPTSTPNIPTPTPCNEPACSTPVPTPTCNAGACGSSPTPPPPPTGTPNNPTPTPCNSPACATPNATPTICNAGACGNFTPTPEPD